MELQDWSHFSDSSEASLLKQVVAAGPAPPVRVMTRGVKEPCSTSRTLFFMYKVSRVEGGGILFVGLEIGVTWPVSW